MGCPLLRGQGKRGKGLETKQRLLLHVDLHVDP